jgi:hypothetical protein
MSIHLYRHDGERYRDFLHRLRDHRSKVTRERRGEADVVRRARLPTPDNSDAESDASDCVVPDHLFPAVARALRPVRRPKQPLTKATWAASYTQKEPYRMPQHFWRAASPPSCAVAELPRLRPRPWRLPSPPVTSFVTTVTTTVVSRKRKRDDDAASHSGRERAAALSSKRKRFENYAPSTVRQSPPASSRKRKRVEHDNPQAGRDQATHEKLSRQSGAVAERKTARPSSNKRRRAG